MMLIIAIWLLCAVLLVISNFNYSTLISFWRYSIFTLLLVTFAPIIVIAYIVETISLLLVHGDKYFEIKEEIDDDDDWDTK
jgi:hypothetical protein